MKVLGVVALLAALTVACASPATSSPTPIATADIKRSKIDIAYSFFLDSEVHNVTSKSALEGAIAALRAEARRTGGNDEFPAIEFEDKADVVLGDFRKFADAAGSFAARNRQISPERLSDIAIGGMLAASPDCHNYLVSASGGVIRSRPQPATGALPQIPAGTPIATTPNDEAGLAARLLPGGIVYVTFRLFTTSGVYKIEEEVRKVLERGLAGGGRAWLLDLRANSGGRVTGVDILTSYFLNGEPTLKVMLRTGPGGTQSALQALRLPDEYQLPMAVLLNDRSGSGPEIFAASLRENKRATIIGQTSSGCVGAANNERLPDGSLISVVVSEFIGAQTGTAYNNKGVPPDIEASDATAIGKAIEVLRQKIGA